MTAKHTYSQTNFYSEMKSFSHFEELTNLNNYQKVPEDWVVIITDVKGSTKAIEEGRYQDVNTVGAATIVSLNNVMGSIEYPFVFGGDGATVVVPQHKFVQAKEELNGLAAMSTKKFALELRIGAVPISVLEEAGTSVFVAKYAMSQYKTIAVFQGGGLNLAEEKIKKEEEKYSIVSEETTETDLSKLSCVWKPLRSERGKMLSLLVSSNTEKAGFYYQEFLGELGNIVGSLESVNPIKPKRMNSISIWKAIKESRKYHNSFLKIALRWIVSAIKLSILQSQLWKLVPYMHHYFAVFSKHSDYHKFDEMIRMVIDVNSEQIEQIKALCERMHTEKKISYGIHLSDYAQITCVVDNMDDGGHIHFIDGGDGGYAMAAKRLKQQLKLIA